VRRITLVHCKRCHAIFACPYSGQTGKINGGTTGTVPGGQFCL
jgi:hypothetical protein